MTTQAEEGPVFVYQATWSDGRVHRTAPRPFKPGQLRFVGLAQLLARSCDPGVIVVRLARSGSGEWSEA